MFSFKLASAGETIGTIINDENTAVFGKIGQEPKLIDLKITVNRHDTVEKLYNCKLASNKLLTPMLVQSAVAGAVHSKGSLPLDNFIRYQGQVKVKGIEPLVVDNISSQDQAGKFVMEIASVTALLMNNPFREIEIEKIEVNIDIQPRNEIANVINFKVAQASVKAGQTISAEVLLAGYMSQKQRYQMQLKLPESIINKVPSAGLFKGQTDEKEIGVKYEALDKMLEGKKKMSNKVKKLIDKNKHKLERIPVIKK